MLANMKRAMGLVGLAVLSVGLLGLGVFAVAAQADNGYDIRDLRGSYGFAGTAIVVPPAAPTNTPAAVVGTWTFDGAGGCSVSETVNAGGFTFSQSSTTCSYTVNADGRGALSVVSPGGPIEVAFVIVDGRKEIRYIGTGPVIANGVAKRQ